MPLITLSTDRLVLRPPRLEDAEAIFRGYATDPAVARYVLWTPHQSIDETHRFVRDFLAGSARATEYAWVITLAADDILIGALHLRLTPPRGEFGFNIASAFWNRGYGTEAVRAMVDLTLTLDGIARVQAVCHVENAASARVLEKAGLVREAVLRRYLLFPNLGPEAQDVFLYARTGDGPTG